jgi:hypothetical protein
VEAAVGRLLDACVADGSVRPGPDGIAQASRLTEIILDGIRKETISPNGRVLDPSPR